MRPFSICVFCGSRPGTNPEFAGAAAILGREIATRGWRLVYGAGDVGLMGEVARAAHAAGGDTFGVIPIHLMKQEVGKTDLRTFIVTEDMHERKKVMFMNSDVVVVLPGGAGSLDEFFEVLTWAQIGLHSKQILLFNQAGFWDPLIALIDHIIAMGFAEPSLKGRFAAPDGVEALIDALQIASASKL